MCSLRVEKETEVRRETRRNVTPGSWSPEPRASSLRRGRGGVGVRLGAQGVTPRAVCRVHTHTDARVLCPAGRLVRLPVLEDQPVADDPHVPLPHGAHLPHVVGVPLALGRPAPQPVPAAPAAVPRGAGPAHARPQPLLDPQEDAAAPDPGGLELRAAGARRRDARGGQRPGAAEEGAVASGWEPGADSRAGGSERTVAPLPSSADCGRRACAKPRCASGGTSVPR